MLHAYLLQPFQELHIFFIPRLTFRLEAVPLFTDPDLYVSYRQAWKTYRMNASRRYDDGVAVQLTYINNNNVTTDSIGLYYLDALGYYE